MAYSILTASEVVPLTNDSKYQCVCKVPVERQLDRVSPQLQSLDGLCQADKDVSGGQGKHVANITQRLYYMSFNGALLPHVIL